MKKLLSIIALVSFISLHADAEVDQIALRSLVENGDVASLKAHFDGGLSVDAVINRNGCTLLHWAALHGNSELVIALLGLLGVDPHITCVYGRTSLHFAAISGDVITIKVLLEAGIDPNSATKTFRTTPLQLAVYHNNPEAVALLLEAGANPRVKDWCGKDALAMAKEYNRDAKIIEILETYLKAHKAIKDEKKA